MCAQWQREDRFKLFLTPRGSFKTSVWTVSGAIFEIINNPNIRILITNATLANAQSILKGLKEHFMYNERFRAFYPEVCPVFRRSAKIEFGTAIEFTVPGRKFGIKEATVEVGSVEGNLVSKHYDLHIGDDLVNLQNTATKEQIDKVDTFRRAAYSLLEPGVSREVLIGTRWHWDDIYGRITDDPDSGYYVYKRSILEPNKKGRLRSIFPSRFSIKEIQSIKKKQQASLFSSQYMNDPIDIEDMAFQRDWMEEYKQDAFFKREILPYLDVVTCVDPAFSDSKRADFTGIVTIGVDHDDGTYVLEASKYKFNLMDLINEIFNNYMKWKPRLIGFEAFSFQRGLEVFVREEMRRRRMLLPFQLLSQESNRSKYARVMSLQPRVQHCSFMVTRDMDDLIDQMIRFPKAKHDDLVDALAHTEQIRMTPSKRKIPEQFIGERVKDVFDHVSTKRKLFSRIGGHRVG